MHGSSRFHFVHRANLSAEHHGRRDVTLRSRASQQGPHEFPATGSPDTSASAWRPWCQEAGCYKLKGGLDLVSRFADLSQKLLRADATAPEQSTGPVLDRPEPEVCLTRLHRRRVWAYQFSACAYVRSELGSSIKTIRHGGRRLGVVSNPLSN